MTQRIKIKNGNHANLPTSGMLAGEPLVTLDRGNLYVASDATTKVIITPQIDGLVAMSAIDGTADLLIIHDASATDQKEKKVTFNAFKTALNIPAASTDELVAVVSGGTSGFIWGTDGTNGILRMGSSMSWTKDSGNAFVTVDVGIVDGGTF
jgi:hypothetical protein